MFINALPFEWVSANRERLLVLPVPTIMKLTISLTYAKPRSEGAELIFHPFCCLNEPDMEN